MPATNFNQTAAAIAAILIHSIVPVDNAVGCQNGMEGLLLNNGYQVKPTRERTLHTNHQKLEVMSISTNPQITLSFDAKVTVLSGPFSAKHPGTALTLAEVANYAAGVAHGFPTSEGWFELLPPSFGAPAADLYTTQFEVRLWAPGYLTGGTYLYTNA